MTVKQILEKWLKKRGYDGLCNAHCGCKLDNLIPCGECFDDCEPGYKQPNGDILTRKPEGVSDVNEVWESALIIAKRKVLTFLETEELQHAKRMPEVALLEKTWALEIMRKRQLADLHEERLRQMAVVGGEGGVSHVKGS